MADRIIYPISEGTGLLILEQLERIATAVEALAVKRDVATYEDGDLVTTLSTVDGDGVLNTTASVDDDGTLTF